ncbi:Sushi domain-containing protein 3 [Collichthys lucidus]|uniref:Sushi domain-containing protein 3 n=1 Tax=Collichthys lucidus TaxID=240159 RepID=A0A4U5USV8_COLLU|nr:Sushi domain-containing protein 3 [Collichthys lucidus]
MLNERTWCFNKRKMLLSDQSQAQCTPMPLPALGTQKIIQGNGTNVGTVIALQCPDKHKVVGRELKCVMDTNSTHWVGEIYCKPLAPYEDYGFRVAVLASIVSSAIIFLMSMAFITCCLLDCIKEDKRKKEESLAAALSLRNVWDVRQWEEQAQYHEDNRSRYSHKGRNNNNNKTQEKVFSPWDTGNPAMCDNRQACRCHQQYAYGPARTYGPTLPLSALPGSPRDCDHPLLPRNPDTAQISSLSPQYFGPPQSSCQNIDDHHEQLQRDAQFLCSHKRMDTELVDRLFRNLSVPTKVRLAELLKHLYWKGEEACHEFYRGLHIHAEDVYSSLPTRVTQREVADPKWTYNVAVYPKRYVLNDRGPMFFLSCFSFVVGIAILYYYKVFEVTLGQQRRQTA